MNDYRRDVALFRYTLIREPADPVLTKAERGRIVRELAGRDHTGAAGQRVRVSRKTLDRWIRAWRAGGFDALLPSPRAQIPFTSTAMLDLAVQLKLEAPRRTAAHIVEVIRVAEGSAPSARTVQRHFARLGLNTRPDGTPPAAFGRFEAAAANDRWTGDALHGPVIDGHKAYLFAFIDDHSRALTGYRWGHSEDTVRLEAALRHGLASRGIPQSLYVDNGSAFVSAPLLRACGILGIRLVHSRPGRPEGRGKIERFFRTVRDQFLVETANGDIADLTEMNRLFTAWVETVYHRRVHTETDTAPLQRFTAGGPFTIPTPDQLHEAFLWSDQRKAAEHARLERWERARWRDVAVRSRRRAHRPPNRMRVRPVRSHHHRNPLPTTAHGSRCAPKDRSTHPPYGPTRNGARPDTDRHRLPRVARRTPRNRTRQALRTHHVHDTRRCQQPQPRNERRFGPVPRPTHVR